MPNPQTNLWKTTPNRPQAPPNQTNELRARFKLAPLPPSVEKIAGLVKGRENASMEEISEIINTEQVVTERLISMAYPRPAARLGATVVMATSRLGVNRVISVMVGDLLTKAVIDTFETMVAMTFEVEAPSAMFMAEQGFLTGSVKFTGKANGKVTLAFSPHLSLVVAGKLLGGNLDDEHAPEAINDAIGELVNIVTGNLQSRLSDAGLPSEVGLPEVLFQPTLPKDAVPGGSSDQFFFRHGVHTLAVNLSIDPNAPVSPKALRAPGTWGVK
jgi:CheY-specific phosphatase CheX